VGRVVGRVVAVVGRERADLRKWGLGRRSSVRVGSRRDTMAVR